MFATVGSGCEVGSAALRAAGSFPWLAGCPPLVINDAGVAQQIVPPPISAMIRNESCADSGSSLRVGV